MQYHTPNSWQLLLILEGRRELKQRKEMKTSTLQCFVLFKKWKQNCQNLKSCWFWVVGFNNMYYIILCAFLKKLRILNFICIFLYIYMRIETNWKQVSFQDRGLVGKADTLTWKNVVINDLCSLTWSHSFLLILVVVRLGFCFVLLFSVLS